MPHRRVRLRAAFLRVTARASLLAHETFARHLPPWTKIGKICRFLGTGLRECKAGEKKQAQSAMPEGKRASYTTRKHNSPVSSPGDNTNQIVPVISQRLPVPPRP